METRAASEGDEPTDFLVPDMHTWMYVLLLLVLRPYLCTGKEAPVTGKLRIFAVPNPQVVSCRQLICIGYGSRVHSTAPHSTVQYIIPNQEGWMY